MISPKQAVFGLATVFYLVSPESIFMASASTAAGKSNLQSAGKLRSLGEAAMSERRFDDAASFYSQAIELEPDNAANYYKLFRVHSRMRSHLSALKDITQACEVDGTNSEYRIQKAKLLVNLGQCEEAVEEYNVLNSLGGDNYDDATMKSRDEAHNCAHHLKVATQAQARGQWDLAVANFDKALSLIEQNYDYVFMKAQAEYNLGDYYGTVSDTGKILKAHSKHIEAYELRGMAYFRLGEHDTAVIHYREGLKLDPEHKGCKAAHKTAKALMKKEKRGDDAANAGKHQSAVDYWWEAINLDTTHRAFARPTLLKIVKSLSALDSHKEATKIAQEYIDEEPTIDGYFALGDAQIDAEMFQQAVNTFREAAEFEVRFLSIMSKVMLLFT
jgi:DnaJ family protein C protein 3